jgi:hypothetical protein
MKSPCPSRGCPATRPVVGTVRDGSANLTCRRHGADRAELLRRNGQPIDAYWQYARAYNGAGPVAAAYADRVLADAHAYEGAGTLVVAGCIADPGGYINPFAGEAWAPSRNDQGVDHDPLKIEPIRAIGAGAIVGIGSWGSYGPWFDYKLASGQFAGKCVYVAEHIGSILAQGTSFNARDRLPGPRPGPSGGGRRDSTRQRSPGLSAGARRWTT